MTEDDADLVALVGSRLCHDLISPLGAIGNGVELMAMTGTGMSPELQLIAESVNAANARVKFFRVAFGQSAMNQSLGMNEIRGILKEVSETGRIKFDWQVEGDQIRAHVKMTFLALLCMETALPFGGDLTIKRDGDTWTLVGTTKRTKPDADLWSLLDGDTANDIRPAQVQFALLPREAGRQSRALTWAIDETSVTLSF
ncbi:histidine phosphotransferase [Thioclava sp. SK-1]|nr:histidine phosphotransferase [Thioclava sp. SK-1]